MYIENVTELAFDDIAPEDPDFPFIQGDRLNFFFNIDADQSVKVMIKLFFSSFSLDSIGLAEAGIISSKLSNHNMPSAESSQFKFSPER